MSQDAMDPRKEKLIAALYGELSPEDEREFEAMLAEDGELRSEFEELQGTRTFLKQWELPDAAPNFVFMDEKLESAGREGQGFWARLKRGLSAPIPSWGFAGATMALAVLILTGFRVDWVNHGVVFRFGSEPATVATTEFPGVDTRIGMANGPADITARPVMQQGLPVTRDDLDRYSGGMMQAMSNMLDSRQTKQNTELAYILQAFYEELHLQRERDYDELRAQVQGVGLGLMAEQSMTNAALKSLMGRDGTLPLPLNNQKEDKKND